MRHVCAAWYNYCSLACENAEHDVLLLAVVALELKHRAPKAHTMLEIVYTRWGVLAHCVFFFFGVLTNLLVSLSMLQGGLRVVDLA